MHAKLRDETSDLLHDHEYHGTSSTDDSPLISPRGDVILVWSILVVGILCALAIIVGLGLWIFSSKQ